MSHTASAGVCLSFIALCISAVVPALLASPLDGLISRTACVGCGRYPPPSAPYRPRLYVSPHSCVGTRPHQPRTARATTSVRTSDVLCSGPNLSPNNSNAPRATTHPPTELHPPHPHAHRHHPHTPAAAHTQTRTHLTAMQHPHSPHSSRRKTYESCLRLPYPTHRTLAFAARADIRSDADECFLIYSSPTAFAVDDLTLFSMRLAHTLATYYTEIVGLKALSAVKSSSVLYSAHVYN